MNLYVIAGHGAGDPGACANGAEEAERVRALASRINAIGGSSVELGDFDRNYYADGGVNSLDLSDDWAVIELHMDSADGARGGHVEIWSAYDADDFDVALGNFIAEIFPGRADKIRKRGDLANLRRAANHGINYRLLEVCFITSAEDLSVFNSSLDVIAAGILAACGIAASGSCHPDAAESHSATSAGAGFAGGSYRCTVDGLRVRTSPSLDGEVVASYNQGETVVLDSWYTIADGYVWGRYTGASGAVRYIAVGKPTGGYDPNDYLVKA